MSKVVDIFLGTAPCEKCGNWNEVVYKFPGAHPLAQRVIDALDNPAPYASDTAAYMLIRENQAENNVIKTGGVCTKCGCHSCG